MMSLAEIKKQPEKHFTGMLTKGFGKAPLWVKLRVDPTQWPNTDNSDLYLSIRPAFLDTVTLYDPLQNGARHQRSGDRVAHNPELPLSPTLLFRLPNSPTPRDVWLKIETTSARVGYFEVLNERDLMQHIAGLEGLSGLFLGAILIFLIWGGTLLIGDRNRLNLMYLVLQTLAMIYALSVLGFSRLLFGEYLDTFFLDYLLSYSAIAYTFSAIVLTNVIFLDFKVPKLAFVWMRLLIGAPIASLLFVFFDNVRVAMQINSLAIIIAPISYLAVSYFTKPDMKKHTDAQKSLSIVRLYCWLTCSASIILGIALLGLIPSSPSFIVYAGLPYAFTSGLSMLLFLQYRNNTLRQATQRLKIDMALTEEKAAQEALHRRENEQLLSMLGHEMKTPLAVVKMLMGAHEVPEAFTRKATLMINTMADLLERTTHASDLEGSALTVRTVTCDLRLLLEQAQAASAEPERVRIANTADSIPLETDPFLLEIVVKNLIDNALKYSPGDTPVNVAIHQGSDAVIMIEVSNLPGQAGFPDAAQLFQKYYRSAYARHKSGSGLGLYLSHKLAQALGADLDYMPDNQVVKFRLTLRQQGAVSD